ncbi:polysaccharide pyruvyl transferase family protein [Agrobacterium sp. NPDC090273]|uniref:polysaccharide pyruvyl transferase family protein n=1 Tax=Agrobacterium sp. NPDC090273 TaxID=3363919 RepID=UPI00383BD8FA
MMEKVSIFDTSYVTDNLGDQIIMESVHKHLREIFPNGFFTGIPSHDVPGPVARDYLRDADYTFVGGTNILVSHWWWYRQWKLRLQDISRAGSPLLMGVGWHKYQSTPDFATKWIYQKLLNRKYLHSVRDTYTQEKLRSVGIHNVVYTGCPTMWDLTPEHTAEIPVTKKDEVVFTLTAYLRKPEIDKAFVNTLNANYKKVHFWPQMYDDLAYLNEISSGQFDVVEPSLSGVRSIFKSGNVDYIGTRLHCGILALQNNVRSLIVEVDNRAAEISRNTNLPTCKRDDFTSMQTWIGGSEKVSLNLPFDAIRKWKSQFVSS